MSILSQFLQRNQISRANPLPLVHTTQSYFAAKILKTGLIEARPCNIFAGEKLVYMFVGRAAYKKVTGSEGEYWELPTCFIFEYFVDGVKRIFPFDSGAFSTKRGYPDYLSMMDLNDFEISGDIESPNKVIGTFFTSNKDYYQLKGRKESSFINSFAVDMIDAEVMALHKLIGKKKGKVDDRRFSIEMQFKDGIDLKQRKCIAAIFPELYLESESFMDMLEKSNIVPITYPVFPLNVEYFYYSIYEKLDSFYSEHGFYG